jgi:hypothetical protein
VAKAKSLEEAVERCRRQPRLRQRLVGEYREISGEPNPIPRPLPDWWDDSAMFLREMGLMGWDGHPDGPMVVPAPSGLTRLGALAAHELNRDRTRQRQVNEVIMQLNSEELAKREAEKGVSAGEIAGQLVELKAGFERLERTAITATEAQEKFYDDVSQVIHMHARKVGRRAAAAQVTAVDLT